MKSQFLTSWLKPFFPLLCAVSYTNSVNWVTATTTTIHNDNTLSIDSYWTNLLPCTYNNMIYTSIHVSLVQYSPSPLPLRSHSGSRRITNLIPWEYRIWLDNIGRTVETPIEHLPNIQHQSKRQFNKNKLNIYGNTRRTKQKIKRINRTSHWIENQFSN